MTESAATLRTISSFVAGEWLDGGETRSVFDVFARVPIANVAWAPAEEVQRALQKLQGYPRKPLSPYRRFEVLSRTAEIIGQRRQHFVDTLVAETGFLISEAKREVDRSIQTLLLAGEEAKRLVGHLVPVGSDPTEPERMGFTLMRPLGVVCVITPFNSPLNMIAHKAGPAIAAGNSVVVKPAELTPLSADLLIRAFLDAGLPPESIALVHGGAETGRLLAQSPIPEFYSFTGSTEVGREIAERAGIRRSQLELGSISHTIVADDADPVRAAVACIAGGFRKAGQVCTSVQKVLVQHALVQQFEHAVQTALGGKEAGDPRSPSSFIGPVISEAAADRIADWTDAALRSGAEPLVSGVRRGNLISPTVLTRVAPDQPINCREVFGPVVVIEGFDELPDAIQRVNATPFGLTAGVFTSRLDRIQEATHGLQVGTVHINATSSARLDLMPFGGVKQSGRGLEGPAYAIREMSQERFVTVGI